MGIVKEERIGDQTLYLGDSREIIGGLKYDAICTDPPGAHCNRRAKTWEFAS